MIVLLYINYLVQLISW